MSIRPADILTIAPIVTYTATTAYNAGGDNIPFDSIDARHNWFTQTSAKGGLITVGKTTESGLLTNTLVALNIEDNSITAITSACSALAYNEIPALITTIVGTGSGAVKYAISTMYYYYCVIQSKFIDIPVSSFAASGAEIGCPIYYNWDNENFEWASRTATAAPAGNILINYKSKKIPLGNIVAIVNYSSTPYYTVKFGSQEGMGTGLDATVMGDVYHSTLSDISSQESDTHSTYNYDHYLYANKVITPTVTSPSFVAISGASGLSTSVDSTAKTYTITNISPTSGMVNECYFWSIPVGTTDMVGLVSVYITDSVTGRITSNYFAVSGTADTTGTIVVDIISNNQIVITYNVGSTVLDPEIAPNMDPQLWVFTNTDSFYDSTNEVISTSIATVTGAEEITFSVTATDIVSSTNLRNTQLIILETTVTSGATDYDGVLVYHYNPNTSQWDEVLTTPNTFFIDSPGTIDYCDTTIVTGSTYDFTLAFAAGTTLTVNYAEFITYETPITSGDIGKLVEYVKIDTDYGYFQLSANSVSGQPLGIIMNNASSYATPYTLNLLAEGIWDSSATGASGTIGGMGVPLNVEASPTEGDDLWDYGHGGPGNIGQLTHNINNVSGDITKQKRIGIWLDATKSLITIYNSNDFSSYLAEIATDTTTINDATIQIYPKWTRTGITYSLTLTANLETNTFDNRKIDTSATISVAPVVEDENDDIFLAVSESSPSNSTFAFYNASTNSKIADCASNYWSPVSGTLTKITYDDTNAVLLIEAGGSTILDPFNGVYQTQVVTSDFNTIDVSSTASGQALLTKYKHSLPYCGIMVLAHTDGTISTNNRMMLFSYKGYSGYGTNKLAFYNVNIFKKISSDGGTFIDTNWVGSNPGTAPKDYYDPESASYKKYLTTNKPDWSTSYTSLWGSTNSSGWAFKLMYGGGFKLNIIGGGTFSDVQLMPPDGSVDSNLVNRKCKRPPHGTHLRTPVEFDDGNASANDTTGRNLWASINSGLSISTFAKASLATTYSHIDVYTNALTAISYSDLYTYSDLIGSIGMPNGMIFNTFGGTTYVTTPTPTVIWIDPKEIWLDINSFASGAETSLAFVKVANKTYSTFDDLIDDNSMIEFTMAQTVFSDPENYQTTLDHVLIGYNQYPGLMDGESVRFYLKNRKVSW